MLDGLKTINAFSVRRDHEGQTEIVDVMHVHLVNTDLFAGVRHLKQEGYTFWFDLYAT